jgi:8-oxo-dGTP diphosphatase
MPLSDETLEILDPYGLPLGKSKFRSLVHRDGDWHATAHVWF